MTMRFRSSVLDLLADELLGVGGAGEEIVLHRHHVGQAPGILRQRLDVHHPGDVDAAGADEDPDAGLLPGDVALRRIGLFPGQGAPGLHQGPGRLRRGGGGLGDRPGNGLGGPEGPADIDAVPVGGHRGEAAGPDEIVVVKLDAELPGQGQGVLGGLQTHREHQHVEVFLHQGAVFGDVGHLDADVVRPGEDGVGPALDKP